MPSTIIPSIKSNIENITGIVSITLDTIAVIQSER